MMPSVLQAARLISVLQPQAQGSPKAAAIRGISTFGLLLGSCLGHLQRSVSAAALEPSLGQPSASD